MLLCCQNAFNELYFFVEKWNFNTFFFCRINAVVSRKSVSIYYIRSNKSNYIIMSVRETSSLRKYKSRENVSKSRCVIKYAPKHYSRVSQVFYMAAPNAIIYGNMFKYTQKTLISLYINALNSNILCSLRSQCFGRNV